MKLKAAFLADAANISKEGKVNILGIFENIYAKEAPFAMPCTLLIMVESDPMDRGADYPVEVNLVDEDGIEEMAYKGMELHLPENTGYQTTSGNIIVSFAPCVFKKFGIHRFDITVNGELLGGALLNVLPAIR